jgi:NTE family protein
VTQKIAIIHSGRRGFSGTGPLIRRAAVTKGYSMANDGSAESSAPSPRATPAPSDDIPHSGRRRIALGLQGGGAHGAFTWGALDRLLEEPTLEIVGISGTSAGAMNAAVMADGLRRGGPQQARVALRNYWEAVGQIPGLASLIGPQTLGATPQWHFDHAPLFLWFDVLTRIWSPYQINPFNLHPLRGLLERIDFQGLRADSAAPRVFICATNVRTGRRRIFGNAELSADVLLASACLPYMFQAVEIDGEAFWDGGYTGNPALNPLYLRTNATDVVIIGINPLFRDAIPQGARDIINRVNEISFNSTFMLELAAIAFIDDLLETGAVDSSRYRPLFIHKIEAHGTLSTFGASSKMNNDPAFLRYLHDIGRAAADAWINDNLASVGRQSTLDLSSLIPLREEFATGAGEPDKAAARTQKTAPSPSLEQRASADHP